MLAAGEIAGLLPGVVLFLLVCGLSVATARLFVAPTMPEAVVVGWTGLVAIAAVMAEILSALGVFAPSAIRITWIALGGLLSLSVWARRDRLRLHRPRVVLFAGACAGVVLALFTVTFVSGLMLAPSNWDSLTYHLPRALHWLQQGDLSFFTTTISRQNATPPLADVVAAQAVGIAGAGSVAFLPQWLSGVTVVAGMVAITRRFGGTPTAQAVTAVAAASVPMLISQMSTPQADVTALVPITAALVALAWLRDGRSRAAVGLIAVSMALAIAVKTTSLVMVTPALVVFVWTLVRRRQWGQLAAGVAVSGILAILVAGRYATALLASGLAADPASRAVFVLPPSLAATATNVIRDSASSLLSPISDTNRMIGDAARALMEAIGLDPAADAIPIGIGFTMAQPVNADSVGAPIHALIGLLAVAWVIANRRTVPRAVWQHLGIVTAAALLFAVVFAWQPWINRFTFVVVVLLTPVVGLMTSALRPAIRALVVAVLAASGLMWAVTQPPHGLAGTAWIPTAVTSLLDLPRHDSPLTRSPTEQMAFELPFLTPALEPASQYLEFLKPQRVIVDIGPDDWEYVWWDAIGAPKSDVTVEHPARPIAGPVGGREAWVCMDGCPDVRLVQRRVFRAEAPGLLALFQPPAEITVGLRQAPGSTSSGP